jgi:hypothetical protein
VLQGSLFHEPDELLSAIQESSLCCLNSERRRNYDFDDACSFNLANGNARAVARPDAYFNLEID